MIFFAFQENLAENQMKKQPCDISGMSGCSLLKIFRDRLSGVAEISFQVSEPNTRTGSAVSLHGPAISLCLLPVEFSANYAVFVIRIWAASLPLVDVEYIWTKLRWRKLE